MPDHFPQLKELIESRHPKSNKGRMILIGLILAAGLLAAASRSGQFTLPFMAMVLIVIFFFKRLERFFSGSETAWRNFRDNIEGTPLDEHLPRVEKELTGETIEWSQVLLTDHYLLWPKEIEDGRIVDVKQIRTIHLDPVDGSNLLCSAGSGDQDLILSDMEAEYQEIVNELCDRNAAVMVDPRLFEDTVIDTTEDIL